MPLEGYIDYKRREFCKDTQCPIQMELDLHPETGEDYQRIKKICSKDCIRSTYEFHHWLIEKGYLLVRPVS